jgi:hypothetical protein
VTILKFSSNLTYYTLNYNKNGLIRSIWKKKSKTSKVDFCTSSLRKIQEMKNSRIFIFTSLSTQIFLWFLIFKFDFQFLYFFLKHVLIFSSITKLKQSHFIFLFSLNMFSIFFHPVLQQCLQYFFLWSLV